MSKNKQCARILQSIVYAALVAAQSRAQAQEQPAAPVRQHPSSDQTLVARASDTPAADAPASDSPDTAASGADQKEGLQTVFVTADKRNVDVQKASLAISAVSAETLQQANIVDPSQLNGYAPGLIISHNGPENMVSLRGVGSNVAETMTTQQPGVSFNMDSIYIANSVALNVGFLDVDHVEVLRGPQGTVFGQSSTGGTINVINVAPQLGKFSGDVTGSFGNYDLASGTARINLPVGDTLAFRGAFETYQHDGFSKLTEVPDYDEDNAQNTNGRITALWRPVEGLSVTLSGQRYRSDQHAAAEKSLTDPNPDPRVLSQDFPGKTNRTFDLGALVVDWNSPWFVLKSTTSYQDLVNDISYDSTRSAFDILGSYRDVVAWNNDTSTWIQEITLSRSWEHLADLVAGGFYLSSQAREYTLTYTGRVAGQPIPVLPESYSGPTPSNLAYESLTDIGRHSWAPFFQLTYHASDVLRLVTGARYNKDNYSGWSSAFWGAEVSRASDTHDTTGKAAVEYDLTKNNMLYVSWSRGYKPGGVNSGVSALQVPIVVKSETVDSLEVGSKNRLLDNRLTVNVDAFYMKYRNMQFIQEDPVPNQHGIDNIPRANIWGMEAELDWLLGYGLRLGANATALDGNFPDHFEALDITAAANAGTAAAAAGVAVNSPAYYAARASAAQDIYDNTPPQLSKFSAGVNLTDTFPLPTGADLITRAEALFRGGFWSRVFNNPQTDWVPSYQQFNLSMQYQPRDAQWDVGVAATNLANTNGINNRTMAAYAAGIAYTEYIPPRQVIATFHYRF